MILKDVLEAVSRQTGAIVNIDGRHPRMWDVDDLAIMPHQSYHHGPYCLFRKLSGEHVCCARNKARSLAIAAHGRSFWGSCPFGVWDFAKPIFFNGSLLAVVYLGGYSDGSPLLDADGKRFDGPELEPINDVKRRELSRSAEFISEFIQLACQNWVDDGNRWDIERSPELYAEVCRNFISARYTEPVRLQDLAENLRMTPNHLGLIIKERFGKSFRALLQDYRIERAKVSLAAESWKSITQIAYECGFSDSNYFSTVFKRAAGVSPRLYRKDIASTR